MPEIKYDFGGVMVTFAGETPDSSDSEEMVSGESREKMSEKILGMIKSNHVITIAELAETTKVTTRTIERYLKNLQRDNLLKRIGPDKGGHWEVLELKDK